MKPDVTKTSMSVSRRRALKIFAALGGAAALSTIPNNWEKPLIEVGSLPAFAQLSQTVALDVMEATGVSTIDGGSLPISDDGLCCSDDQSSMVANGVGGTFDLQVCVDYHNAVSGICRMYVELNWPVGTSPVTDSFYSYYSAGEHPDGTGSFCDTFTGLTQRATTVQVCITLYDCNLGFSNTLCDTITITEIT